ncbi:MAG: bifunctional acetate--CoA ligase family protein/GNAT family N-acetyltransferase, partial [Desulfosarcinaceae bacterium]
SAAAGAGIRVIGPNCLGIMNNRTSLNATFATRLPPPGNMAFISQSGAVGSAILDLAVKEHIGFSHFISLGSMLDVNFGDLIDYLGQESEVASIVIYMENLMRFRYFMSAARAVSRIKPIVVYKAGRSKAGAAAATSHTGAMAGSDEVYDTAFQRAGIVRVRTFEELFDCAELLSRKPNLRGSGLGIVTNSGGPGVMAVDSLADYGMEPAVLSKETLGELNELLPPHWSHANPVDMIGEAGPREYQRATEICLQAPEIDCLLVMLAPTAMHDPAEVAEAVAAAGNQARKPLLTSWLGGDKVAAGRDIFNRHGIATFDSPERAVRAFHDLVQHRKRSEMLQQIPPRLPANLGCDRQVAADLIQSRLTNGPALLDETESKKVLQAYGIPVTPTDIAHDRDTAVHVAERIGYPVALKIFAPGVSHKTDFGGIKLNLETAGPVAQAFEQITQLYDEQTGGGRAGVNIQPMLAAAGPELILGAKADRDFGPVLLFGMGGTTTEVFQDKALALPPLNRLLARRMMESTKVFRLLTGYRDRPPANLALLEEILIRLSMLVCDFSEISELDINPLMVVKDGFCAVDARIALKPPQRQAPNHLVISPYPAHLEERVTTHGKVDVLVRPIRPEDAGLLEALFETLSQRSVYLRFFAPLKNLPHGMLARFTQIDYDREIALVAIKQNGTQEQMLGVARVIPMRDMKSGEFAVLVGDPWQGSGIGAALLMRCLNLARERGLENVCGEVLAENTQMLRLGKKLGFKSRRIPESSEYEMYIDLKSIEPFS